MGADREARGDDGRRLEEEEWLPWVCTIVAGLREREKKARFFGCGNGRAGDRQFLEERKLNFRMWYQEEGEVGILRVPTASYSERKNEVQQLKNNYLIRTR